MDYSSIANTLSKDSVYESHSQDAAGRMDDGLPQAISNEQIRKGDPVLDTYTVLDDAIHGGMGSVWRVRHEGWNTDLAMKRPQPRFFAEGSRERKEQFVHECESWIRLGLHPNIVSCYYVREIGGVPTVFSEWMDNGSLKNRMEDGALYAGTDTEVRKRLLDIAIQSARGLHYAHESEDRLVHQDIKPDNLLLTKNWEAKVSDFGLARARTHLSREESGAGDPAFDPGATMMTPSGGRTPAYCSPEQEAGLPLTRRTDIYSWGASVLEMYLGSRPWSGGPAAGGKCREYMRDCRIPMPEALKELLAECLELNAGNRPHDFAEVEEELKRIWNGAFGEDYPRPEPEAAADTPDSLNNRALSWMDMGMPERSVSAWNEALSIDPNHLASAYNLGLYQWRTGVITDVEALRRCRDIAGLGRSRDGNRLIRNLEAEQGDPRRDKASFRIIREPEGEKIRPFSKGVHVAVSEDGRSFYVADARTLTRRDPEKTEPDWRVPFRITKPLHLTPDGKRLWFYTSRLFRPSTLHAVDTETGREAYSLDYPGDGFAVLHPDGCRCFVLDGKEKPELQLWDLKTKTCLKRQATDLADAVFLCVSRDGRRLAAVSNESDQQDLPGIRTRVSLWDAETLTLQRNGYRKRKSTRALTSGGFVADGSRMFFYNNFNSNAVWFLDTEGENDRMEEFPLEQKTNHVCIGLENRLMVVASTDRVTLLDSGLPRCLMTLQSSDNGDIYDMAASGDCAVTVFSTWHNAVCLCRMPVSAPKAPWELCRIKDYSRVLQEEQEVRAAEEAIGSALARGDTAGALALLLEAEKDGNAFNYLSLRRKIIPFCKQGKLNEMYEGPAVRNPAGMKAVSAAISGMDGTLAVAYNVDEEDESMIALYDERLELRNVLPDEVRARILDMRVSRDGTLLCAGYSDGSARVWDLRSGKLQMTVHFGMPEWKKRLPEGWVLTAMDPANSCLCTAVRDDRIVLWSCPEGREIRRLENKKGKAGIDDFVFSGDGRSVLFVDHAGKLQSLDIRSGERRVLKAGRLVRNPARSWRLLLSRDGKTLFMNGAKGTCPLDTDGWKKGRTVKIPGSASEMLRNFEKSGIAQEQAHLAASGDGALLAAARYDKTAIWSFPDLERIRTVELEGRFIRDLSFSPDGCMLAAVLSGEGVYVWILNRELTPDTEGRAFNVDG